MLKNYPNFKRGQLKELYNTLNSEDKILLDNFKETISAGDIKILDMERSIVQFRHILQKPFKEIDKDDLERFIPLLDKSNREKYTKNGIKTHLKRFLKHIHLDWFVKFNNFSCIKCISNARNEKKINSAKLLSKEDIEKIIKAENDFIKKAFFLTLFESAVRPIELRLLKWKDIEFNIDGEISKLNLYATKTDKHRVSYIKEATFFLQKLEKGKKDDYVFQSREGTNKPMGKDTALDWIKKMGKKVGIDVYPYLLRHSRSNDLHRLVNDSKMSLVIASKIMGHSVKTFQSYGELETDVIEKTMKEQLYNFEEMPPEKKEELENRIKELEDIQDKTNKQVAQVLMEIRKKVK